MNSPDHVAAVLAKAEAGGVHAAELAALLYLAVAVIAVVFAAWFSAVERPDDARQGTRRGGARGRGPRSDSPGSGRGRALHLSLIHI